MPPRSNNFQRLVAILQEHLAGAEAVTESAMLTDRVTGVEREVDVVVRAPAGGRVLTISLEANKRRRKADLLWVEQMVRKHRDLPTNQLVLVSEAGFTPKALKLADIEGVIAVAPEELTGEEPAGRIVNRLSSLWAKEAAITPYNAVLYVRTSEGLVELAPMPDTPIFDADGMEAGSVFDLVNASIQASQPGLTDQLIRDVPADQTVTADFEVSLLPPDDSGERYGFFVDAGPAGRCQIDRLKVTLVAPVVVREVPLAHRRLEGTTYAYGEIELPGHDPAVVVVTEREGQGRLTVRSVKPSRSSTSLHH
jgi:hypothetical protein